MTLNATISREDTLAVCESAIGNSSNFTEDEPTENKPAVDEPTTAGESAVDKSKVDESDLSEFNIEESDSDESDTKDSDFDESDTEVSYLNDLYDFEAYLSNIDVNEHTADQTVADNSYAEEFKNIVNYVDQCNSDQYFIVKIHTKAIYDLTPLSEEPSAVQLGRFTDKLVLHIWVLQMQDPLDVDRWSGLLMHVIYNKLDQVTRNLWNTFIWNNNTRGRNVSIMTILNFLRATCREYEIKKPPISLSFISCVYNDLNSDC